MVYEPVDYGAVQLYFVVFQILMEKMYVESFRCQEARQDEGIVVFVRQPERRILHGAMASILPTPLLGQG